MIYLVGSLDPALLRSVRDELAGGGAIAVTRVLGPPEAPQTLIVRATAEAAEQLRARYAGRLVVEPDRTLPVSAPVSPVSAPVEPG